MTEREFKNLLDKFLQGNATQEEEDQLLAFEKQAINESKKDLFRSDLEKRDVKNKIYQSVKKETRPNNLFKLGIAASVVLFIGVCSMFFVKQQQKPEVFIAANTSNSIKEVILKDGSIVTLNKASSLKYINDFNGTRRLDLVGEAFFKVKRNEKKPFIVKTKGLLY